MPEINHMSKKKLLFPNKLGYARDKPYEQKKTFIPKQVGGMPEVNHMSKKKTGT
jgi:hypothetical protein